MKPRLPQEVVLFKEQYEWGVAQQAGIAAYDARLREFQQQGMPEQGWTAPAGNPARDAAALHGRDALRGVLHVLDFPLR